MGMGSNMKNNLETLLGYLLEVETVFQRPSIEDINDAIEHVKDAYSEEIDEAASIEDFEMKYLGKLSVKEIGQYDDLSSWMERIEDEDELRSFRGERWKRLTDVWGNNPPPVIVVSGETFTTIGDGRGRVTYAAYKNIPLDVWELTYKRKNAKKGDLFENGVSGVSKEALLGKDPLEMSEDEYVDTYFENLMKLFPQSMHELDNYVPLSDVRIQYDIIPKDRKEDIRFWLKSKTGLEGEPKSAHVRKIGEDGEIREPVILDLRNDFTVEGRHRLAAALKYDLDVPVLLIMDEPQ